MFPRGGDFSHIGIAVMSMENHIADKLISMKTLARTVSAHKQAGRTVVHCHGVFDLLHIGHIRYFEQAKQLGQVLIVTVTPDRFVDKGPYRPAFEENLRAEAVASLHCVDHVAINTWPTAEETLRLLRPDVYVKGSEFKNLDDTTGKIGREAAVVKEIGARLAFTDDIVFSSTHLINRYLSNFPKEINQYLEVFRSRHTVEQIHETIEKMHTLRALVVGDTILDEYQYCNAIGKSSKDPALVLKFQSKDLFAGGVLAVANHVAGFAEHVGLATVLGEQESREAFVREQLLSNISPHLFFKPGAPTTVKSRFVDAYSFNKVFEVYIMDDTGLPELEDAKLAGWLEEHIDQYDVVIASDFGHGAISPRIRELLIDRARFLAVNTQSNAGNLGLHTLSKYRRADYVSIAEHEIRLDARDRSGPVIPMMQSVAERLGCGCIMVTRGRNGCTVWRKEEGFVKVPALARNVVDRVGAGDAVLSVTSLATHLGVSAELLGFIGNVVGALAVEVIGNKRPIDKQSVLATAKALMG